jgi:hypothetical protein
MVAPSQGTECVLSPLARLRVCNPKVAGFMSRWWGFSSLINTKINILAGDYGGEMDPHGAECLGFLFFFLGGFEENDGAD